ncbi:MAG: zinc-binding dehydrogenase [Elusimicrobia bacterium]|nr:zinc-binding dehydrogenase [Elusimicrobiota bacterium]
MKTLAAVLVDTGKPLVLAELEIPALQPGQVIVEIGFSGVCHTQLLESRGYRGKDAFLPHCLGHEGSGTVVEIGPGVSKVAPGDQVILSWMKGSGADVNRVVYRWGDRQVNAGGVTTFGRHAVVSENRLTVTPPGISPREAALLGCAVPTGLGAVLNTAAPKPGQSLAVFGVGGIGLCSVAGAVMAGCAPIIALDVKKDRVEAARSLGASHGFLVGLDDVAEGIKKACPGGLDFAIEASGRPEAMRQALSSVRPRGGTCVIVGNARHGERLDIEPMEFNLGKRLLGTWGGDNMPDRDFPRYAEIVRAGSLDLKPFLSASYLLEAVNEALDDLEAGRVLRPLIEMAC